MAASGRCCCAICRACRSAAMPTSPPARAATTTPSQWRTAGCCTGGAASTPLRPTAPRCDDAGMIAVPTPALTDAEILARLLYRDGLMLILDKPAGLPVHAGPKGGPV